MESLLRKLPELLHEEYKLQTSVKEGIEFLQRELESLGTALRTVTRMPRDQLDEQVKIWADDVRELSYDTEDVIDNFLARVEGSSSPSDPDCFKWLVEKMTDLFNKIKARHQIANDIKNIKDRVQEMAARRDRYNLHHTSGNPSTTTTNNDSTTMIDDPRIMALFKDQRELVGIDEPRDELIKRLTEEDADVSNSNQPLKKLSIFGFGGLGKTTLAKAVYDKLQAKFVRRAFISVGQNPSVKKVLKDIIRKLDKDSYLQAATLDHEQLIEELRGLLEDKRYLIVIDDIWDINSWNLIKCALVDSNCGSVIIITTRILQVAERITNHVYKHKPLYHRESRELFFKRLSINRGTPSSYDQSAEISEMILQKCGGVPLAIITIASLLDNKLEEDWLEVYDSIGFRHNDNIDMDNTRKILRYSYYDLPCYLRTCLLYLAIYPEDYEINKKFLIWKWVAEGFVIHENSGGVGLFELGERYFNELINRSMIQPRESHDGIIYGCRVHDLVLDMINLLSKEDNFVVVLGSDEQKYTCLKSNTRRLAIQKRVINQNDPLVTMMPQVRSFNTVMCHVEIMPSLLIFHGLRVLAFEGCTFTRDHRYPLEHLGKLLQLRYLGLSGMHITEIPSEIGNLKFLQTLDLNCTEMRKLPPIASLLRQLKCLHLTGLFDMIGNLPSSLEELWLKPVFCSQLVKELDKLTELRELRAELNSLNADLFDDLITRLCNLHKLRVVRVSCQQDDRVECTGRKDYVFPRQLRQLDLHAVVFIGVPVWVDRLRLPYLTHLNLKVKTVEAKDVDILGCFRELISLQLHTENHAAAPYDIGAGAFAKLRYLDMSEMLRFLEGAMPCLEDLCYHIGRSERPDLGLPAYDRDSLNSDVGTARNLPCLQYVRIAIYGDHSIRYIMKKFARLEKVVSVSVVSTTS